MDVVTLGGSYSSAVGGGTDRDRGCSTMCKTGKRTIPTSLFERRLGLGWSTRDIARRYGIPEKQVKMQLAKKRERKLPSIPENRLRYVSSGRRATVHAILSEKGIIKGRTLCNRAIGSNWIDESQFRKSPTCSTCVKTIEKEGIIRK